MWSCEVDDPRIINMDPVRKLWMYNQWLGDHRDNAELAKNHAYLLGSFWNAEAVQEMMNDNKHESTDEELEESMRMVMETDVRKLEGDQAPKRKKRRRATLKE